MKENERCCTGCVQCAPMRVHIERAKETFSLTFDDLTPEQKAAWKNAMMPTYDTYRKEIGAEYLDKVIAEVARLQAQYDAGKLNTSRWR